MTSDESVMLRAKLFSSDDSSRIILKYQTHGKSLDVFHIYTVNENKIEDGTEDQNSRCFYHNWAS